MRQTIGNRRDNIKNLGNSRDNTVVPSQKRKIRPTRRSVSGVYAFRRDTGIPFESTLERDFLIRSEYFSSVAQIIAQPVQIPFVDSRGRQNIYTPDFLVYRSLGNRSYREYPKPELIEVKPQLEWRAHWRKWSPKWKAARTLAKENGWVFRIQDETRIRDQVFENIHFLERYKRMSFDQVDSDWVLKTVEEMGSVPFHYLLARHYISEANQGVGISHLWHLLATRKLDCDISNKLDHSTELWLHINEQVSGDNRQRG